MRALATTVGQAVLLTVFGLGVGLSVNAGRGKKAIDPRRDYFPPGPSASVTLGQATAQTTSQAAPTQPYDELTFDAVVALYNDAMTAAGAYVFIDARNDENFERGHVPGAIQCDHYAFEKYIDNVAPRVAGAAKVIVYCNGDTCEDSLLVCRDLAEGGFVQPDQVYLYTGGWEEWIRNNMPVATGRE
jgi:rhodanese-related sulfurtransferase